MPESKLEKAWDELVDGNPCWAMDTSPSNRGARPSFEFVRDGHGRAQVEKLVSFLGENDAEATFVNTVEVGCGLGCATYHLADISDRVLGVDISSVALDFAQRFASREGRIVYRKAPKPSSPLMELDSATCDLVYSCHCLQHQESVRDVRRCLADMARVLAPGGLLVFQMATHLAARHRLQGRTRPYWTARKLGISSKALIGGKPRLHPMKTLSMPESEVIEALTESGLVVLESRRNDSVGEGSHSCFFLCRRP